MSSLNLIIMPSKKVTLPYESDCFYHLYNRGNNKEKTFYKRDNYFFFLYLYQKYIAEYVDTYCYALLPNHYHFLIKVNYRGNDVYRTISNQFKKLNIAYTQVINNQEERSGNLFQRCIRRKKVPGQVYLKRLVYYIHSNPFKHRLTEDFKDYPYSSYPSIINNNQYVINVDGILSWFNNDIEEFRDYHKFLHEESKVKYYLIEEG